MEKRDYLMAQIEQMGKALAKILSDFLQLKSKGQTRRGIEIADQRLQGELDIDIERLNTLNKNELKVFSNNRNLTAKHLEILSDYLREAGTAELEANKIQAKTRLEKAGELLDIANEISETISFERISKKTEIEKLLQA